MKLGSSHPDLPSDQPDRAEAEDAEAEDAEAEDAEAEDAEAEDAEAERAATENGACAGSVLVRASHRRRGPEEDGAVRGPGERALCVTRKEKAERIRAILDEAYPETPIPLAHRDPFTLLVAVLLSAQTSDAAVNQATPALFERAPTPEAMAGMSAEEILPYIRRLGLAPGKARHLAGLARLLVERHGGRVPRSFEELEALPGVGHKTASVVMAQAFGVPAFPVDTHVHRLAARWGLSSGRSVVRTESDLKKVFPESSWNRVHLQIIFFGREHCPALRHDMDTCPICSWAASKKAKRENAARGRAKEGEASAGRSRRTSRARRTGR